MGPDLLFFWGPQRGLDIEPDHYNVPILDYIVLTFSSDLACFFELDHCATFEQILAIEHFRADKAALEIRMDFPGGFSDCQALFNRPDMGLFWPTSEEGDEAEVDVGLANNGI